ncbi:DUF4176 domain-containing protein [Peribacillus deserti]|uniref:DUF4176 domain-containing protein n=1 Tax=Peribacillus deserti TaxID=673318 RepID=A0A2N5M903_9BACI|nr:DUF4176 domain-containing protein [Peribacillus deserti]PLT30783.1 hypothetical protein CUU66_06425 [Peribacillus deserti]
MDDLLSASLPLGTELLPIGSVLLVKQIKQPVMVYGRKQKQNNSETIWDYVACPYPHGHISSEYNIFFNHDQIHQLMFKGLETTEELEYRNRLSKI